MQTIERWKTKPGPPRLWEDSERNQRSYPKKYTPWVEWLKIKDQSKKEETLDEIVGIKN